ncbi:hypothetical protein MRB53_004395 [Persea americana]|uniref:Uncharacterized protein n=1 Tax=Persea americana TaxID=3435 RepID=A0ACC2MBX8_PERAE|nr:hypothetical protein MRB53_004395 [Persea americana]
MWLHQSKESCRANLRALCCSPEVVKSVARSYEHRAWEERQSREKLFNDLKHLGSERLPYRKGTQVEYGRNHKAKEGYI